MFHGLLCWLTLLQIVSTTTGLMACPAGWTLYGRKCYKKVMSKQTFRDADKYCRSHNSNVWLINNAKENNMFIDDGSDTDYWIALKWDSSNSKWMHDGKRWNKDSSYNNWTSNYRSQLSNCYSSCCVTWSSKYGHWEPTRCVTQWNFVCEQNAGCSPGFFGSKCSKTCHCYGEVCKTIDGACKYGCQKRWMGKSCDKRKIQATALYYCLNTKEDGNALVLRVNQHGIDYKRVFAVDENDNPVSSCNKSSFSHHHDKLQLTIKHKPSTNHFQPDCGVQHVSNQTYKWKFHFVEFPGIFSVYDVIFEVTCDFEKADELERGASTDYTKDGAVKTLSKTDLHVELTILDPYTGRSIKMAKLDENVRLVMQLWTINEDIAVKKISPHSCMVGTEDGVHAVNILDYDGCSNKNSPILFSENNGTSWWSTPFNTFTFPGYTHVIFTCHFDICFSNDDPLCNDRCVFKKSTSNNATQSQSFRRVQTGSKKTATVLDVV